MILQELNIGHEALGSILRINFPNGSFIQLFGADASNARNRLRGRKYKLIIADEMGFFQAADGLIKSMIPMLADYQGTLCMTSSPGELLTGLFYEADMGEDKDNWSRYSWDWSANPHFMKPSGNPKFKTKGEEELDVICRLQFGGNREHPAFRREYLGLWVEDSTSLIYPARRNNLIDKPFPYDEEEYGIGIDLGSSSDNAIVVVKFGPYNRDVQIIECYKESHLLIDQLAAEIQARVNKYNPIFMVADTGGYGAGIVPELRKRYHLNIEAADKKDKGFYQRIVSNDLLSEYIKVVKGLSILDEWKKLTKDEHGDEIEGPPNHASDAFLYIYRKVYNTYLKTYSPKESEEDKMIKQLTNSIVDKEKKEFWENFWLKFVFMLQ